MVPHIGQIHGLLNRDSELAGRWGLLLEDLDSVFSFKDPNGPWMDSEAFFEDNEEPIVQPIGWMEADSRTAERNARALLADYRTVANFHSLRLPKDFATAGAVHMALLLQKAVA